MQKKLTAGFGTEGSNVCSEMVVHFYIKAVDNILNYFFLMLESNAAIIATWPSSFKMQQRLSLELELINSIIIFSM